MSEHHNGTGEADPQDAGLTRLYRESANEVPPPQLDAAILAAARREAGARPQGAGRFAARRWRLPLALAAVLVLSVSVVTMMSEESGDGLVAPDARAPRPVQGDAPAARESARGNPPAAPAPQRQLEEKVAGRAQPGLAQPEERKAADAHLADRTEPMQRAAPPAATSNLGAAEALRDRAKREAERDAAPAPLAKRPAAPEPDAGAAREGFAAERAAAARQLSPEVAREVKTLQDEPPDQWLERITTLRRDGREGDAAALLAEFRRRFPRHPLPESMKK